MNKEQKRYILNLLIECNADADKILRRLQELHLYDCTFSLRETSQVLKVSKERVRQIEVNALKKIRKALCGSSLHDHLYGRFNQINCYASQSWLEQ